MFHLISHQRRIRGIRISMSKELSITMSNGLPSTNMIRRMMYFSLHVLSSIVSYSTKFNPPTIQQRQPQTQCAAGRQKRLRMGSGPKLFSGLASSDREKLIFGKKIYCFLFVRSILFHLTGSKGNKAKKKRYPQHLGLFSSRPMGKKLLVNTPIP